MALTDPTETITSSLQDISYTAGQEPWNKNLNSFDVGDKSSDVSSYICNWKKWHGLYRKIPEARSTIDVWSFWVVSKKIKFKSKEQEKQCARIRGNGKDTFRKILKNGKRVSKICGDFYAEIIRDKANRLINLKPLNSGSIRIDESARGIIKKYVQVSNQRFGKDAKVLNTWGPDKIFHVSNDRIGDEIHGIPELEKTHDIMKWKSQCMNVTSVIFFRYIKPLLEVYANTDDPTEIADLAAKYDAATKNMENLIIPKGAVEKTERVSVPQYSTLDPLPWLKFLRSYYTESSNVPDLIRGKSDEVSLAAGKLNYLGYKEKIEMEQIEYEEEIKAQLGIDLTFERPKEIDVEIAKTGQDMNKKKQAKENKVVVSGAKP